MYLALSGMSSSMISEDAPTSGLKVIFMKLWTAFKINIIMDVTQLKVQPFVE
jgi:hypothetical protein